MVPPLGNAGRLFRSFTASNGASSAAGRASAARIATPLDQGTRARYSGVSDNWQVTDIFTRAEEDPTVVFADEAIDETATQMLGQAYRVEEPMDGSDADLHMQAAEAQMTRNPLEDLFPVIRSMMRDPDIQRAALRHLSQSSHFQQYLVTSAAAPSATTLALPWHETEVAAAAVVPGGLPGLIEELGARLTAAGEAALKTAAGFRNALGRFLINLGANLHAFLGKPFTQTPLEEGLTEEQMDERAELVGQALTGIAIAILSIVFLKRAHLV